MEKVQVTVAINAANPAQVSALNVFLTAIGETSNSGYPFDPPTKDAVREYLPDPSEESLGKTKKKKAPAKHAAPAPEKKAEEEAEEKAVAAKPSVSMETLRAETKKKAIIDRGAVVAAMKGFGVSKLVELTEDNYDAYFEALQNIG